MPRYMLEIAYTSEAWATMVKQPQDRIEAVRPVVRKLGGTIETAYFAFGEYDLVAIVNMPDAVSVAAFSIAASAGGSVKAIKTTSLMTIREGMQAMRKAKRSGFQPPSS